MIPFGTKSVTLSMLIDLLTIVHVDPRRWRSHQLTSDLKRCLLFRKCLLLALVESESSFVAYVSHRRPGGFTATSDLVSCNFQHPWTQRCSVFKRALSLSVSSMRNAREQPVQMHRGPHQLTGWVGAVNRESAIDLLPHSFHVSLCAVSHMWWQQLKNSVFKGAWNGL